MIQTMTTTILMIQTMITTILMIRMITTMILAQVRRRVAILQAGQAGAKDLLQGKIPLHHHLVPLLLNRHRRQPPVSAQRDPGMGSARQAQ